MKEYQKEKFSLNFNKLKIFKVVIIYYEIESEKVANLIQMRY